LKRFAITALVIGVVAGCTGAAPTPSPTGTPATAATANPAPTASSVPAASATPEPTNQGAVQLPAGDIDAGTYTGVYEGYRFTFTVPDSGWSSYLDTGCCVIYQGADEDGAQMYLGGDITRLYADACESAGSEFEPGPTVDDLVSALTSLEGFETSGPTDVELNGYEGKRLALTVPADVDVRSPDCYQGRYSLSSSRWYQAAGQSDAMWILDVDGQRLVLTFATTQDTPAELAEELDQIRDSIQIKPV
jgi:hypothetical protein